MTDTGIETDDSVPAIIPSFKFSVVIPNYNYERFVGEAIESALSIDWPDIEVIVVDDGSTDHSRAVIEAFGDRITSIFQANSSQAAAYQNGFAKCSGDLILFLDSDDLVDPSIAQEAALALRPHVSKIQFQMRTVDAEGAWLGSYLPQYTMLPSPAELRQWNMSTGYYPSPPGSGNIYTREFLEKIIPFYPILTDKAGDTALVSAAPYLGDVIVVPKPIVSYRIHGGNQGALVKLDEERFGREVKRAMLRHDYARGIAQRVGLAPDPRAIFNSLVFGPYRISSLRLAKAKHPIADDSSLKVVRDSLRAAFIVQGFSTPSVFVIVAWTCLVALSPIRIARALILWRFSPASRPAGLKNLMRWLKIMR